MKKIYNIAILPIFLLSFILLIPKESKANLYWNQAVSFAGSTDSYIASRDDADLDITGDFTIEAWVNPTNSLSPTFQIIFQKRQASAAGYTLYLNNGRVTIRTLSSTRLVGKTVIPSNEWTHIAGTYDLSSNTFRVFVNGDLDTSVVIAGAAPTANNDSLLIGKGANDPFAGMMDEIRIWNTDNTSNINKYHRTSLAGSSGKYDGLVYSLTFQDDDDFGNVFSLNDFTLKNIAAKNNGVSAVDLGNRPSNTIHPNDCLNLDGNNSYLSAPDSPIISPVTGITLSAWIYPRSNLNSILIHKGPVAGGAGTDYRMALLNGNLFTGINGTFFTPGSVAAVPLNKWTYVAFTYNVISDNYKFYINGKNVAGGIQNLGNINNGTDSLYIGGTLSLNDFDGYIDEVSISPEAKTEEFIGDYMFRSRNLGNVSSQADVVYNFDGYSYSNSGDLATTGKQLFFRNAAGFAHNGGVGNAVESPLIGNDNSEFQEGFHLKSSDRRIPATGTSGNMISDTLEILQVGTVNNIKLFIGLNHTFEGDLQISLTNPAGNTVTVFDNMDYLGSGENLVTIFNDLADSSLLDLRYVNLSPQVKPLNNMISVFGLSGIKGKWILKINDQITADSGRLSGWGIQFNNQTTKPKKLNLTAFIQGFYNLGTNQMIRDTMKFYLRDQLSPHDIVDSAKAFASVSGFSDVNFSNADAGRPYYLTVNHRNLIETWSSSTVSFDPLSYQLEYDFTKNAASAYGSNLIPVDLAPLNYACYNGDVNQDQTIDIADLSQIDNDAFNFNSGYLSSDVNGDAFIDLADYAFTDNNAANFVGVIVPPAPPPAGELNETKDSAPSAVGDPSIGNSNLIINRNYETDTDSKEDLINFNENYKTGRKISQEEIDKADGK